MQKIIELKIEETKAVVGGLKGTAPVSVLPPVTTALSPSVPLSF